jgi:3-hydroxybutyryl-CoA dehydrogenase
VAAIQTIAVIGAGGLGRGIAMLAALGGYQTILEDLFSNALRRAESEIRASLEQAVAAGKVTARAADAASARIEYAGSLDDAARRADLVIEAGPDEFESKSEIFILLDKICRPSSLLATSTLTQSVTEISSVTYRAPQCFGMRFGTLTDTSSLELVLGKETSKETLTAAVEVGRRMGTEVRVMQEAADGALVAGERP